MGLSRTPRYGGLSIPQFLEGKTPASMTFPQFQRIQTVANQGGAAERPLEIRLNAPENLIYIRRPNSKDKIKGIEAILTPNLIRDSTLIPCYKTLHQVLWFWDT